MPVCTHDFLLAAYNNSNIEPNRHSDLPTKLAMAKKTNWKDTVGKVTLNNPELNRKALKLKKSFDEIDNLLKGLDKSTKKHK